MTEDFVLFQIRCQKSLFAIKIKSPIDISGFVESLKNELKVDKSDDLVILCPLLDGKMMEIQSDDDIKFLKNTKLTYDIEKKQIYCNVELVVLIINELRDDSRAKFKILSNRLDQLTSQVDKLSDAFKKKIGEHEYSVISTILMSILAENSEIDLGNNTKQKSSGEPNNLNLSNSEPKNGQHQKETKNDKEKSSSTSTSETNHINLG